MLGLLATNLPIAAKEWQGLTQGAMWLALVLAMLAGALKMAREYRRGKLRFLGVLTGRDANSDEDAHSSLTKFRELHERGGLSDSEYRIIKSKLASELNSKGDDPKEDSSKEKASADAPTPKDNLALVESLKAAMASNQGNDKGTGGAGSDSE